MNNLTIQISPSTPKSFMIGDSYVHANDTLTISQDQYNKIDSYWRVYVRVLATKHNRDSVPVVNNANINTGVSVNAPSVVLIPNVDHINRTSAEVSVNVQEHIDLDDAKQNLIETIKKLPTKEPKQKK